MKKIVFLFFIATILVFISENKNEIKIPNEAIRIRIIANSNDIKDQKVKSDIKNDVNTYLFKKLDGVNKYSEAQNIVKNSIVDVENIIKRYTNDYDIKFGENFFPEKKYHNVNYESGEYESIVISLGKAEGENFWCVLFPPICMIDEQNLDDVTYELYINKLLKKLK